MSNAMEAVAGPANDRSDVGPSLAAVHQALVVAERDGEQGRVLAWMALASLGAPTAVFSRVGDRWRLDGAAGLRPSLMGFLPAGGDPERWVAREQAGGWLARDLAVGGRVVARLCVRVGAERARELEQLCATAAPFFAFGGGRAPSGSQLQMHVAQIVHDLRRPLTTLSLSLDRLRERRADQPVLYDRCLRAIGELASLSDDLLLFSTGAERSRATLALDGLLGELLDEHRDQAGALGVELALVAPALVRVHGDRVGLHRAFGNLILNALEHSPRGGVVRVHVAADERGARVEVRDQGPGVPPHLREAVFTAFYTTRARGAGLGLTVVRQVVDAHGGTVEFVDGEGAVAQVWLPIAPPAC